MSEPLLDSSLDRPSSDRGRPIVNNKKTGTEDLQNGSTLIEFPGVSRVVPEWRKQLSQRVREVQERRAREAAEAAALKASSESVACALPSAQLELVPVPEQPAMKPIVSKALERLERARQATPEDDAPVEVMEQQDALQAIADEMIEQRESRKNRLVVVPPVSTVQIVPKEEPIEDRASLPEISERQKKPVRLIADGIEDQALSYLETCLSIPVVDFYPTRQPAGNFRRFTAGVFDLLFVGALAALAAFGIHQAGGEWKDPRVIEVITGISLASIFTYSTLTVALTGRTLGMRIMSLRTIDKRTGLIPTGGQSIKRAIAFTLSLVLFGLGFLFALIDRDGRTVHDRFSQTIVVHD
jgi:uncharacterized RDD family membrane protein YckC